MSQFLKTKKEIKKWLNDMKIKNYEIKTNTRKRNKASFKRRKIKDFQNITIY